ncbi:MAG: UDP-N-acetylmuramate dehydrogenase [Oscillospiraceae bacterium]
MKDFQNIIELAEALGCECLKNEPLTRHTTFKIGGNCPVLIKINSAESGIKLISTLKKQNLPYLIIGNGSNLIVDDDGIERAVLLMASDFSAVELIDNEIIACESGASLSKVCAFACENSLSGLEFAWGIPGSIGGAVYMNAGAYGGEISDVFVGCDYIADDCTLKHISLNEMDFSYRHSFFSDKSLVIVKTFFKLIKAEKAEITAKMDDLISRRKSKQPLEFPSAGSTFKRPVGNYASLLIEQCGLKGFSVGDAEVSKKHSGFIINKGNATFAEVMELIKKVKEIVKEKTGFVLECEPKVISDKK